MSYDSASYRGKDLFEAAGMPPKTSHEFKKIIDRSRLLPIEDVKSNIRKYAYYVFPDKVKADYFIDEVINELGEG